MLKQSFELYHYLQKQMKDCEKQIESILQQYITSVPEEDTRAESPRANKVKAKKNMISIDIERHASKLWGVNLSRIYGISDAALLRIVGELGHDFTSKFNTYKKFCCWANVTPNNKISGGKLLSSKVPRRKNPVGLILRSSANSLKASKTPLGFYFRKIQTKSGYIPAIIATANKLGRMIYTMVKNKTEFDDSLISINEEERLKRKLIRAQMELDRIQNQIKKNLS